LKALFGTATTGDIHIHQALDKLQGEETDVHSLENQMAYIKNFEFSSRVNSQANSDINGSQGLHFAIKSGFTR